MHARSTFVLLAAIGLLAGCGGSGKPEASTCGIVERGVLPGWARTGFSDARPTIPHVIGQHGRITGIHFEDMLSGDREKKVLWVAREPWMGATDLQISARDGKDVVERTVAGGPGPSGLVLPHAGCWQLKLRWADQEDTLALRYGASRWSAFTPGPARAAGRAGSPM
jgi:hypothetical protein